MAGMLEETLGLRIHRRIWPDVKRLLRQQGVCGSFALKKSDLPTVLSEAARVSCGVSECRAPEGLRRYYPKEDNLLIQAGCGRDW